MIAAWAKRHWLHILLSPVIFLLFTVLHECAHALAAMAQGATITDFSVLPSDIGLGYMSYQVPDHAEFSPELVSIAPYMMWGLSMVGAAALSARKSGVPFPVASTGFLWGFAGAWGDISLACLAWLNGQPGDLHNAFGTASEVDAALFAGLWLVVAAMGYPVQKRLYRSGSLSPRSYAVIAAVTSLVLALFALLR